MSDSLQEFVDTLGTAVGLLQLADDDPLRRDLAALRHWSTHSNIRIAVFAPFNYGKSTLLNALLGERALPIDLIPTTGAAITVRYGEELRTRIGLVDGREICEAGTEILKQFAVLDDHRHIREDVASVEVWCPHDFLRTGVELVDLPGTDDQEAQDALVKHQLLTADWVVQVLDARKLMTLQERENLRDWLLDRGIETVVFVVNFTNLLQPDEQKQVVNRLRFVAESFRADLPPGVSNLYRVDALPALRARLKGDRAAAQAAGLSMFETALQTLVETQQLQPQQPRLGRVKAIAQTVEQALQTKIQAITAEIAAVEQTRQQKIAIQQKAQTLIQQGFATSVAELRTWLEVPRLRDRYRASAISALQRFELEAWIKTVLQPDWQVQTQRVVEWVYKACDFFNYIRPVDLWMTFPPTPDLGVPQSPTPPPAPQRSGDAAPVAIATGLGWVLGGPVGAIALGGASYLLNQKPGSSSRSPSPQVTEAQLQQIYEQTITNYLSQFSTAALSALAHYEITARPVLHATITAAATDMAPSQHQLALLQTVLDQLQQMRRR